MSSESRVLIVDDKELVRDTVRDTLYDFNCVIKEAHNGAAALTLIEAFEPDVIILDLKLQDMSGLDVLRAAKRRDLICCQEVIVLTGLPEPSSKAAAAELGVFAYLTKPISWHELRRTVARLIPQSAPAALSELTRPEVAAKPLPSEAPAARHSKQDEHRKRILILDDNERWLQSARETLETDFDVTVTTSAKDAIRHVRKNGYALVVLDKNLPENINGVDVLEQMRKVVSDLRALIMTEDPDKYSMRESFRLLALDYLEKTETRNLNNIVHRILDEPRDQIRVFLSYVKEDRPKVSRLHKKLTERGFFPWMDYKNASGGKWMPKIEKEIETTDYFVFCLSPQSISKKEGVINKEVRLALERQSHMEDDADFFVIARIEQCEPPKPLSDYQYFDVFRSTGFAQLVRALSRNRGNSR